MREGVTMESLEYGHIRVERMREVARNSDAAAQQSMTTPAANQAATRWSII